MKKLGIIFTTLVLVLAIFVSCEAKEEVVINNAADLAGKKIGVQGGTTGESWVQNNVADAEISSFRSGMDAALDLKNGALDAVVLDELPAKEIVARNSDLMIVTDKLFQENREEYAIAVKKGNTELLNSINTTIETLRTNGGYEKLVLAYMPTDGNIVVPTFTSTGTGGTLKLGTNAAFPPFEYVDGTEIVGFDITMGQHIANDSNKTLEIHDMAFDSLIAALDSGVIDFVAAGMSVTPERQKNVDFSAPYYESEQVIIIRK